MLSLVAGLLWGILKAAFDAWADHTLVGIVCSVLMAAGLYFINVWSVQPRKLGRAAMLYTASLPFQHDRLTAGVLGVAQPVVTDPLKNVLTGG